MGLVLSTRQKRVGERVEEGKTRERDLFTYKSLVTLEFPRKILAWSVYAEIVNVAGVVSTRCSCLHMKG